MSLDFEKPLTDVEDKIAELSKLNKEKGVNFDNEIAELKKKKGTLEKKIYKKLSPWQTVQIARHPKRPLLKDYISGVFSEFIELHGDRCFGDDQGIIGGLATVGKHKVVLIGHRKGKTFEENMEANFGMATPDGYRKAMRLMKLAEKYRIPVVSFIDTPGAYPGMEAEARGQAEAIAKNLTDMAVLETPILVIITGEGGSGGAIGIGVGDVVLMLSNSVYSVISPEGCASILWRDGAKAPEAAEALKVTANSLYELGIVDGIIDEPDGGAHRNYDLTITTMKKEISKHLDKLKKMSTKKLLDKRFEKYASIGKYDNRKYSIH